MKLASVKIKNFRRLESVAFTLEEDQTILVGPNNSGKTSTAAAFRSMIEKQALSINDFTVACLARLDDFGSSEETGGEPPPMVEIDLWFAVDPATEYGRVSLLLPTVAMDVVEVGIRVSYCATAPHNLHAEYRQAHGDPTVAGYRRLSEYLRAPDVLKKHYGFRYYALEREDDDAAIELPPNEGRAVLKSLVRVDFIDAQRNIRDDDDARASNRLSKAFAAYYKNNLQQPEQNQAAKEVLDKNNESLTKHYETHFEPLLQKIALLGVPSAHDRTLQLVSSLSAEEALQGSTELFYYDSALKHQLPEMYNGLGFKNLIYMAIQMSHFHAQWLATPENRPLCQIIFVEEPEVHLHAQVQQIFITNMWSILHATAESAGEPDAAPQMVLSTHSSHIVVTAPFDKVRYFRRVPAECSPPSSALIATRVVNLKLFKPTPTISIVPDDLDGDMVEAEKAAKIQQLEASDVEDTLRFLRKYLKLTHCDLFFADAAILVEGAGEKMLLPKMIEASAVDLKRRYITTLEVGGAYAHRLAGLLSFLGIPSTIIADIDTVDPAQNRRACRADTENAHTSNATLRSLLGRNSRTELLALEADAQICDGGACFIGFQRPSEADVYGVSHTFHARTLEEAVIHANLDLFLSGALACGLDFADLTDAEEVKEAVYHHVRNGSLKKTEFALDLATSDKTWKTPDYIQQCLKWLEAKLAPLPAPGPVIIAEGPQA